MASSQLARGCSSVGALKKFLTPKCAESGIGRNVGWARLSQAQGAFLH
ncbi:hypothetical protein HMPREF0290_2405 [Corynebacterium efficiens YS-314]|nr:hypothetical protein HMPREF0290_2405 [Corynebacterium efficiens YS-314]